MSVVEIENAVQKLPPAEVDQLAEWLDAFRSELWDKQIEADDKAGRLDFLIAEVEEATRNQTLRDLP